MKDKRVSYWRVRWRVLEALAHIRQSARTLRAKLQKWERRRRDGLELDGCRDEAADRASAENGSRDTDRAMPRERMSHGRLRAIESMHRRGAAPQAATKHVGELLDEVFRCKQALAVIADSQPTARPARTGNADLDLAYNLAATAREALVEPETGRPDIVCRDAQEMKHRERGEPAWPACRRQSR